jgi:hypothetical protein
MTIAKNTNIDTGNLPGTGEKLKAALAPALLVTLSLFLFLPFTIYRGNIDEFVVSLPLLLASLFFPALLLLLLLLIVAVLAPGRAYRYWLSLLIALGVLIWIEGSLINWDYGDLDGLNIDWTLYRSRALIDISIWVAVTLLSLINAKKIQKKAALLAVVLIVIQFTSMGLQSIQTKEVWSKRFESHGEDRKAPDEILKFSKTKNVIHVILDQFQSDIFHKIINDDPKRYYTALDGFTFFPEATSSAANTTISIPAILSGRAYKNDIPIDDYLTACFKGDNIYHHLYDNGYDVDLINGALDYDAGEHTNKYFIDSPYGVTKRLHTKTNALMLLDLSLFRVAPHYLKKRIYNDQNWFVRRHFIPNYKNLEHGDDIEPRLTLKAVSHRAFLIDMTNRMTAERERPVYKFIHLLESHVPSVFNEDCSFSGGVLPTDWKNIFIQKRCALNNFISFLDKLKELGIYDSSLIIVNADHGNLKGPLRLKGRMPHRHTNLSLMGVTMSLLAVKPPGDKGPLKLSNAQVELADIPATISSILGLKGSFGGRSVFSVSEDETRERRFYFRVKKEKNYYERIDEFIIKGSVFESDSWRLGEAYLRPGAKYDTKKIDFGTREGNRFLRFGWSGDVTDEATRSTYSQISSSISSLFLTLPKEAVRFKVAIGQNPKTGPVTMIARVDGKELSGKYLIDSPGLLKSFNFKVDKNPDRPKVSVIEFEFTEYPGGEDIFDKRLLFESLSIE